MFDSYDSDDNTFYKIKSARKIQERFRAHRLRKRIKSKITIMNEDKSEDDIDISQISKENKVNNSISSESKQNNIKDRLNTSESNFIVTMAQNHKVNNKITEIDMIKGNFLLKKTPFNYIQNGLAFHRQRINCVISQVRTND